MAEPALIIGVGNPDRGDDGVGAAVVERLKALLGPRAGSAGIALAAQRGEATALLETMRGRDRVTIVDAVVSGAAPGSMRCFQADAAALPSCLAEMSSHGFGVAQAIELARALGELPARCRVYGVEAGSFEVGTGLSPAVAAAVEIVAAEIIETYAPARAGA